MTWILGREPDAPRVPPTVPNRPAPAVIKPPARDAMARRPARPAKVEPPARPAPEPAVPPERAAPERAPAPPLAPSPPVAAPVRVSINAAPWAIVSIDGREVG